MIQEQSSERQIPSRDPLGRVLVVDLAKREWYFKVLSRDISAGFLGGRGVNAYLLSNYCGFENRDAEPIVFAPGLLTGVIPFGLNCLTAFTTGSSMRSLSLRGSWGLELKMAGYDHLMLVGKAESPVVLKIYNGRIDIEDAAELWDKGYEETEKLIQDHEGDREIEIMVAVGAGDSFPKVNKGAGATEAAGLTGLFAAKKLKAISARGTRGLNVFNPLALKKTIRKILPLFSDRYVPEANNRLSLPEERSPVNIDSENGPPPENLFPFSREDLLIIQDCLGFERHLDGETILSLVYSVTGIKYSLEELGKAAQRIKLAEACEAWE